MSEVVRDGSEQLSVFRRVAFEDNIVSERGEQDESREAKRDPDNPPSVGAHTTVDFREYTLDFREYTLDNFSQEGFLQRMFTEEYTSRLNCIQ